LLLFLLLPGIALGDPLAPISGEWTVAGLVPGTGTGPVSLGIPSNTTGTASHPALATTNYRTRQRRMRFASAATAGSSAGNRSNLDMVWRGNAANLGGFIFTARFGSSTAVADQRAFVGLYDTVSVIGNVNPSTLLDAVYFGYDNGQTTWRACGNDNSGAAVCIDCGASFPVDATAVFEGWISADPNAALISYRLRRLDSVAADCTGTISVSGNLPRNSVMLAPQVWINNGATASAAQLEVIRIWISANTEVVQ
jgi:hypothetical protein